LVAFEDRQASFYSPTGALRHVYVVMKLDDDEHSLSFECQALESCGLSLSSASSGDILQTQPSQEELFRAADHEAASGSNW